MTQKAQNMRHGFELLAKLHLRMVRGRPEMDVMAVFLLTIVCLLGAVGLMLNHAVREMFHRSGDASTVLVTARGSSGEVESFIKTSSLASLRSALSTAKFKDLNFDDQLVVSSSMPEGGRQQFLSVRGAEATTVAAKNRKLDILEGRMFAANANELVVGRAALHAFPTIKVGSQIELANQKWLITGIFEMQGDIRENELWGELQRLQYAHGAYGIVSSIRINAADAAEALSISDAINADDELEFSARSEADYFEQQARPVLKSTTRLQSLIMGLMIPIALLGLLSIQRVQNLNILAELRMLSFIGFQWKDIQLSLIARSLLVGMLAAMLVASIIFIWVADRSIELEMGLQVLDIRFQAAPWIYALIVFAPCMLAASAAMLNNMKTELQE